MKQRTHLLPVLAPAVVLVLTLGLSALPPAGRAAPVVDHSLFAELLRAHVQDGRVDYDGFQRDEAKLDRYLDLMARTDTGKLPRAEQYAFYINAYNGWTIKLILSKYPDLESIKDLGGFLGSPWRKPIAAIDGKTLTLDNIEHDILRPRFRDPRVHFAVNCASIGCPPLRSEPYRGADLERQLDDQVRTVVNDPKRTRLDGHTLYVNKVCKWYRDDFPQGILAFVLNFAEGDLRKRLLADRDRIEIDYLHYDWRLNKL